MAIDDNTNLDYGLSGSGSYQSRSGQDANQGILQSLTSGSQTSPQTTATGLGSANFGMDQETINYLNASLRDAMVKSTPDQPLGPSAYYPLGNEPIEVGQFSGPMGSVSLMSEGAPEIPYDMLYAKQRARQLQDQKRMDAMTERVMYNIAHVKEKTADKLFVGDQYNWWDNKISIAQEELKKNNVPPEYWNKTITQSSWYRKGQDDWKLYGDAFNDFYDVSVQTVADYLNPGVDTPYVSRAYYDVAQDFLNLLSEEHIDPEKIAEFNPYKKFHYAQSMEGVIEDFTTSWNANAYTEIDAAIKGGRFENTDIRDVYVFREITGIDPTSPETKKKAKGVWERRYGTNPDKDSVPDFEKVLWPELRDHLIMTEKATMQKVEKESPVAYMREKRLRDKDKQQVTIPPSEEESKLHPGTVDKIWNIPPDKQKKKAVWIATGSKGTYIDANGKTVVGEMKEGWYLPATLRLSENGDVTMDYILAQRMEMKDDQGRVLRDQNNEIIYDYTPSESYTVNAPYSHSRSSIETGDDITFEGAPNIVPYTQTGGWKKQQGGPKVGDVDDGYRFKGGDPSKSENWEEVK